MKYRNINVNGIGASDLKVGDIVSTSKKFYKVTKPVAELPGEPIIEIQRPVDNCNTEFSRDDFHIGDTVTYWYRDHPETTETHTVADVTHSGEDDDYWRITTDQGIDVYPYSNDGCRENVVVEEVNHRTAKELHMEEYKYTRKDFEALKPGDKVKYRLVSDPEIEHVGEVKRVSSQFPDGSPSISDAIFRVYFEDGELIFPLDHSETDGRNAVVTNIIKADDWDEVVSVSDNGVSIKSEPDDSNRHEPVREDTIKQCFDANGFHVYRKRTGHKLCDLSRIEHGAFMLMDNAKDEHGSHKYHDDTVYYFNENNEYKRFFIMHGDHSGAPSFGPINENDLPCDTFAVKPASDILLKTINGEM